MRYKIALISILLVGCCLVGCERREFGIDYVDVNALVVKPASKANALVYTIGSVYVGGGTANPSEGSSHRSHFYHEKFADNPNRTGVEALVTIRGFRHNGVDYTLPGQFIDQILINGLDESLGLGSPLYIPMNQGKYEGGNEQIKDVQIKSYSFASYNEQEGHQNRDADINIVITSTAGDFITIRYANDLTPYDGYW